jgi:hypothetical protein
MKSHIEDRSRLFLQKRVLLVILFCIFIQHDIFSQVTLNADGPGETYELISSVLAPGYDAVEVPDCGHLDFGRHIDELFDTELNKYVFRFFIHTTPDNDRCINFDRQRNEIKTYDQSPDTLLATQNEKVEYKWKFKLDSGFQASSAFTHLHQLKAVGGSEESIPLITLTARKGNPDQLELRYAESTNQITQYKVDLTPFKGAWVEVTETVLFGENGTYSILIKKVDDGTTLLEYTNNSIRTWKTDAEFIRPKWGIYRSLTDIDNLRDETLFFSDFSIKEINTATSISQDSFSSPEILISPNPASDRITIRGISFDNKNELSVYDLYGRKVISKKNVLSNSLDIAHLNQGLYFLVIKKNTLVTAVEKFVKT